MHSTRASECACEAAQHSDDQRGQHVYAVAVTRKCRSTTGRYGLIRHTFAQDMANGGSVANIKDVFGHGSMSWHATTQGQAEAIQAIANIVAKIRPCQLVPAERLEPPANDLEIGRLAVYVGQAR